MMTLFSVVVPSLNDADRLEATVTSLRDGCRGPLEIIVVDNGSTDGCADFLTATRFTDSRVKLLSFPRPLGVVQARTIGAKQAQGSILLFSDAHVLYPKDWDLPFREVLADPTVGIAAPLIGSQWPPEQDSTPAVAYLHWTQPVFHALEWKEPDHSFPHPVPLVCGCCQAMRRDVFDKTGGFDQGMINWGAEDQEICLRFWLLGYQVISIPTITVQHYFPQTKFYPLDSWHIIYNYLRTIYAHFNERRVSRWIEEACEFEGFDEAYTRIQDSDIWDIRLRLEEQRIHDDDWFMEHFGMTV
jgi:GT2 family glycosyltransferase